ncbi:GNAT family N-acetyltransferase [Candidatus Rhodobacter oscarellae]|uniref:GNAT family N-acetyltransferase n=1 Tax=Candidatus Rhodobacter oscarellae TaxID=1675527 RepID=UPI000670C7A7|nr:GNAT family protein [Candidatus Rhodobacter lobularis]
MEFEIDQNQKLRVLQSQDTKVLFSLIDKNRSYLRSWLPWLDYETEETNSAFFIRKMQRQLEAGESLVCGIFVEGELVGMCGYNEIDKTNQSVEIGYWLSEDAQGNGIITRAADFFIEYAFEHLGIEKVQIPVAEENFKSRSVCERLGLVSEGVKVDAEDLYGEFVNHVCYALTKDQWMLRP